MLKKKVKNDRKVKTAMSRGTALPARPAASATMSAANFGIQQSKRSPDKRGFHRRPCLEQYAVKTEVMHSWVSRSTVRIPERNESLKTTLDLRVANAALSQLSYTPVFSFLFGNETGSRSDRFFNFKK